MEKIVTFGEIMLRLATPARLRFSQTTALESTFGGGEANVAVSLANYGVAAEFVTRLPQNDIADWCVAELRKHGVQTANIARGGSRVGIYYLETGAVMRPSKVVYDRAGSSIAEIEPGMIDWRRVLEGATWFHWTGITPAISQGAADACLEAVTIASEMGLTVSCDLNFRKNLWKYGKAASDIMPALVEKCDVIIGNEEDAEKVFGIKPATFDAEHTGGHVDGTHFEEVCRALATRFPRAHHISLTLRGSLSADHNTWGACLWAGGKFHVSRRYDITHIVDRVGGGDSYAGGLIYGLMTRDDAHALEWAVAASALKHTISGDFNLVTTTEVDALAAGNSSGRVSR
jgi:2-dehydro-3-deoxygluconokinase